MGEGSGSGVREGEFGFEEVGERLAAADEAKLGPIDEDLGGEGVGIVVGRHREPVRPRAEDREEVAARDGREEPVAREEVSCFADGTDDVAGREPGKRGALRARGRFERGGDTRGPDEVECAVEGGTDERVHARVADHEATPARLLDVVRASGARPRWR
jgi:hypothetical protein